MILQVPIEQSIAKSSWPSESAQRLPPQGQLNNQKSRDRTMAASESGGLHKTFFFWPFGVIHCCWLSCLTPPVSGSVDFRAASVSTNTKSLGSRHRAKGKKKNKALSFPSFPPLPSPRARGIDVVVNAHMICTIYFSVAFYK